MDKQEEARLVALFAGLNVDDREVIFNLIKRLSEEARVRGERQRVGPRAIGPS
jgi:hypothetical protein